MSDAQDVDGKLFVKERVEMAAKQASFWQDYKFVNPVTKKVEPKEMYCERLDNTAVCARHLQELTSYNQCCSRSSHRGIDMFGWIKNIGLSWKVQLAPAFLILVLIGVGAYALLALRSNQAAVDALVSGPVRQSELANDLTTAAWTAHAKLYRLAATAANEKDEKKVAAFAKEAFGAAARILGGLEGGRRRSWRRQAGDP